MKPDLAEIVLIGINLVIGIIFSFIMSKRIFEFLKWTRNRYLLILILLALYLFEGITIAAGMLTPLFTFGLATITGIVFGFMIRKNEPDGVIKSTLHLSCFLCLPAITLIIIPVLLLFTDWNIFSSAHGSRFGIPEFIPFPLNAILGFYFSIMILFVAVNLISVNGTVSFIKNIYELRLRKN